MKKFFALMALVLGMVSCQNDFDDTNVIVGGEQEVTINVAIPEAETRAAADTDSAKGLFDNGVLDPTDVTLRYIMQVYDAAGNPSKERQVAYSDETSVAFKVRLVPERHYNFVVWADVVTKEATATEFTDVDNHYITKDEDGKSNLNNITLNPNSEWNAMDETRDAFTGYFNTKERNADKPYNGSLPIDITLTRPFAKLRVVTTDMEALGNLGIVPTTATVKYVEVSTAFNAYNGKAAAATEDKEHTRYTIATYGDNVENKSMVLFTDYLFANDDIVKFEFEVFDQNNQSIKYNNFNTDINIKRNHLTTISGNVLTDGNNIKVEVKNGGAFDGEIEEKVIEVNTAEAAQAALDSATDGDIIKLLPGVNYGVLYLRPAGAPTKVVDWIGNNYRYETYTLFENLTIVGAEGATVDAIEIEGGTYYNTAHSQSDKYPVMLSLIELKNVVFDGVTFTGKGGYDPQGHGNAINLSGSNIKVDGLTLKNCVLKNNENNARLLYKTESTTHVHTYAYNGETYTFSPSMKDITVTGCTFNGGYMGMELRETENVTITNNEFNVGDRNILLASNSGCTYSGNVTITGNVSNNAKERFVRMSGAGDAKVIITDNKILNYRGEDADYIKVTDGTNVTIENNIFGEVVSTVDELQTAINNAKAGWTNNVILTADITGNVTVAQKENVVITIDGANHNFKGYIIVDGKSSAFATAGLTIKNLNFNAESITTDACINFGDKNNGTNTRYVNHVTIESCTFDVTGKSGIQSYAGGDKIVKIVNCTATSKAHSLIQVPNIEESLIIEDCEIYSKNGINLNQSRNVVIDNCTANVKGYAVRFGQAGNDSPGYQETYTISNCNFKSECADGDAVIILRGSADDSTLNLVNTTLEGTTKIANSTNAKVYIDGALHVSTADQLKSAIASNSTVIISSNIEATTIKLPNDLQNFTLSAAEGVSLKNTTISTADGSAYHYENLTFDGITFDNSRIVLTGWRTGEVLIKNLVVTNCVFENIEDTTNNAAVHINMDAAEAVENFTFTNNVINGLLGGSKSGVYAQVTGKVVFENNVINNVSFRPYVIQITTDDAIADTFTVRGNTFSGSSVGRAQGLGNNSAGTDAVTVVVSENIFMGITESQQICYWNFNPEKTTTDLSKNYYDIDIEANPGEIYFNSSAASKEDLKTMGVYPFYTELNSDGTINTNSLKYAE